MTRPWWTLILLIAVAAAPGSCRRQGNGAAGPSAPIQTGQSLPISATAPDEPAATPDIREVRVTSYWTADQRFYSGRPADALDRTGRLIDRFSEDFLAAVRLEGWGRVRDGPHAGRFLGYMPGSRSYALADDPLDAGGRPLIAWRSIAAGPDIPRGSRVRLLGVPADASPDPTVRRRLDEWFEVTDVGSAITSGRLDIYVGPQDRPDMNRSPAALRFAARAEVVAPAGD